MALKLPEREKRLFWGFKSDTFHFFVTFRGGKLKPFSGKADQSLQNGSILKFVKESFLEIRFEATLKSKTNFLSDWKGFFCVNFWVNKLKMFLGKTRQSIQNCANPKTDIENILENGFETTLSSKADVLLNRWKRQFSVS